MGERLPLLGKRILVTRAKEQAKDFSDKIKQYGGTPLEVPLISFKLSSNQDEIKEKISKLDTYDWLIFTSKNGVDFFFHALTNHPSKLPKIAVVGTKTNDALIQKGYQADLLPSDFIGEGLTETLKPLMRNGDRFLLARGNLSRSHIPNELRKFGGIVDDLVIYDNDENVSEKDRLQEFLSQQQIDVITFTSPSTVRNFVKLVDGLPWREWLRRIDIVCIGPVTKEALQQFEIDVHVCPSEYTTDSMLTELISYYKK
ncbi:uroporphyrinogen-III synthase [Litchfieldia salsa]|uniref:Uroporphyrinogen-III synthase n=1 Tax=Litchfieldia salsa TaxID=930152 RepID=A0A1H0NV27_9BACI|nr:uroporphyrinogen-III synthase [Litchfieldia salsa]SDO96617.1 uroporphyrinogen-III synthase [Litchfieldia salsa]